MRSISICYPIRTGLLGGLLLLLSLPGCNKVEKLIEENQQIGTARLKALEAIGAQSRARPVLTESKVGKADEKLCFFARGEAGNAAIVYAVDLADPTKETLIKWQNVAGGDSDEEFMHFLDNAETWYRGAACLLRKGVWTTGEAPDDTELVEQAFANLARMKYALVLRLHKIRPPFVNPGADSIKVDEATFEELVELIKKNPDDTFFPGRVSGDAQLYRLADGHYLGGFTFTATNDDKVEVDEYRMQESLMNNLHDKARWAFVEAARKHLPGADIPY